MVGDLLGELLAPQTFVAGNMVSLVNSQWLILRPLVLLHRSSFNTCTVVLALVSALVLVLGPVFAFLLLLSILFVLVFVYALSCSCCFCPALFLRPLCYALTNLRLSIYPNLDSAAPSSRH